MQHAFTDHESWALKADIQLHLQMSWLSWALKAGIQLYLQMSWLEYEKAKLQSQLEASKGISHMSEIAQIFALCNKALFYSVRRITREQILPITETKGLCLSSGSSWFWLEENLNGFFPK